MEKEKSVLLYELCRLCLAEPGSTNVIESTELARDIFLCTGVKVSPTENLPNKICKKCFEIITNAKDLRTLALNNDSRLRSLLENNNEKIEEAGEDLSNANHVPVSLYSENKTNKDKDELGNKDGHIKKLSFDGHNTCTPENQMITVRKDLFESSTQVALSTNEYKETSTQVEETTPVKKRKKEDFEEIVYECEMCNKSFDKWKQLYLHQRLHNKTFKCPLDACLKKFACKSDLEKHLRVHTGVRPYQCDLCEKSFTQNVTLKSHKEAIHHSKVK